jgi:uncharacterized membrane protein
MEDLKYLRLMGIFQLSIACWLFMLCWKAYDPNYFKAALIAITIFTLPPFQIMVAWAASFILTTAVLLSCLSAFLLNRQDIGRPWKEILLTPGFFVSIFLLCAALTTYPSTATFYWVGAFVCVLSFYRQPLDRFLRKIGIFLLGGFGPVVLYALALSLIKPFQLHKVKSDFYNPYTLTDDIGGKLIWFVKEPLFNALNLWNIFPNLRIAIVLIGILGLAVLFVCFQDKKGSVSVTCKKILFLIFSGLIVFLAYFPNLLAKGNAPFYRCSAALSSILLIFLILSLEKLFSVFVSRPQNAKVFLYGILIIGCVYAAASANRNSGISQQN